MIVLKAAQEKILRSLQAVAGIVERRHTLPVLANVLIRKTGDQVEFTASDLEIQIRTSATLDGDSGNFADRYSAIDARRPGGFTVEHAEQADAARREEPIYFADASE
jgi:DNA polymerase III sliding clamp (beta) subunit (PCNA family)